MYCPRCGHQPISDALRFCSYCGFKLGVVKASLADTEEVSAIDHHFTIKEVPKERQRDINIGVILMFAGAGLAALLAGRVGREGGALLLAVAFASILVLSRPIMKLIYKLLSWEEPPAQFFSVNQRRMIFGSILMFISTILMAISSLFMFGRMRTAEFLFGLVAAFTLLLILSKHLIRALRYLVATNADVSVMSLTDVTTDPVSMGDAASSPALTAGQDVPVSAFISQRVTTAEILAPPSVTEQTTNLLENK
jgi:zinc-ribbon domain